MPSVSPADTEIGAPRTLPTFGPGGPPPGPNIAAAAGFPASASAGNLRPRLLLRLEQELPRRHAVERERAVGLVMAVATSNSDSLTTPSAGTTSRIPRFAIGPSGPTAVPLTRDVGISRKLEIDVGSLFAGLQRHERCLRRYRRARKERRLIGHAGGLRVRLTAPIRSRPP